MTGNVNEKRFYEEMIPLADRELTAYLDNKERSEVWAERWNSCLQRKKLK
jgi:hypothetical protein